jgi:phosphoesterase RecJ-like protein
MEIDETIKKVAPEIKALINRSSKILLACHPRADFDSVGSVLALGRVLLSLGKEVTMIAGDTPLPKFAVFYPGSNQILPQNFWQTDLTQFDLFIATDMSARSRLSELGVVQFPANLKTVVIDHHASNESFGEINLVLPQAAATAEILFQLFISWEISLSAETALCLLLALYGDTGSFRYPNVSSRTLVIASELLKLAPDYARVIDEIENNEEFERLRFRAMGITKAERFFAGKLIVAAISNAELKRCQITPEQAGNSGLASALRAAAGCIAAVSLTEEAPGQIKFSSRSRNAELCDVSLMAKHFGGGGHQLAAGAVIKGRSLEQVKTAVLNWFEKNC